MLDPWPRELLIGLLPSLNVFYLSYKKLVTAQRKQFPGFPKPIWPHPLITSTMDLIEHSNRKLFLWILKSYKGIDVIFFFFFFGSIIENRTIAKK